MRRLSKTFMTALILGFLSGIRQRVINDNDLDLQIRDNYINIYYKGNSLLKLTEIDENLYRPEIHQKFIENISIHDFTNRETTEDFLSKIPAIKENIIRFGSSSLEVEYEQLLIRANNNEVRNNSEYFIVDRQLTTKERDRFDLTAVFWDRSRRRQRKQVVPLCFMELKFTLNTDIQEVHNQLERYYNAVKNESDRIFQEAENVFRQKLELGLFGQSNDRIEAMKTLRISRDIEASQFIIVMVDYNPYSTLLDLDKLKSLSFANQLKIFFGGFAMWQYNEKVFENQMNAVFPLE